MLHMIRAALRRKKPPTHDLFAPVTLEGRVRLTHLDINLHMSNARYLTLMDRCRLEHSVRTGLLNGLITSRCAMVLANTEVSYIRELRPYQRFTVDTRLLGWDEKYSYMEQRFLSMGKLHTHALLRLVLLYGGRPIAPDAVQDMTGLQRSSPLLPEYVQHWKRLLQEKRRFSELHQEETDAL